MMNPEMPTENIQPAQPEYGEQIRQGRIILLPAKGAKGLFTIGSEALGIAAAIAYEPGDQYVVSGGYTNKQHPYYAESSYVEAVARLFNPDLPQGVFHHNQRAKNSWDNIADSRPVVEELAQRLNITEITVIATKPHGPRFMQLCQEAGMTHRMNLATIENLLAEHSPETRVFLEKYLRSGDYRNERITEAIWRFYHTIDRSDRLPKAISQRRGGNQEVVNTSPDNKPYLPPSVARMPLRATVFSQ